MTEPSVVLDLTAGALVGAELQHEIEQFLYREARLLDEDRLSEWLRLLAEDIEYVVLPAANRNPGEAATDPYDSAVFHDDKESLAGRVKRVESGMAWAEEPRSRTRHCVSNVQVTSFPAGAGYLVESNLLLFRSRLETTEHLLSARRADMVRRGNGGLELNRRTVHLDHAVLMTNNLSTFL